MTKLRIEKTGNFWIDNGIIGLYKVISTLGKDNCCELSSSAIEFFLDDEKEFVDILNMARQKAVTYYLKRTGNFGWIYKDNSFEIYEKTDFKTHLKPFFVGKTGKPLKGALGINEPTIDDLRRINNINITQQKDSYIISKVDSNKKIALPQLKKEIKKGRTMTNSELSDFVHFLLENDNEKFEGLGYFDSPPIYEIGDNFNINFLEEGKKICSFSGKKYKFTDSVSGMDYPFLTGKTGELNFSSHLEGKPQMSSLYSFVALFSFYNLNYLLQDDMKHYFVLYDNNLNSLSEFLNSITAKAEQLNNSDYCNFETELIGTTYESEAFFNFLVSMYNQLKLHFEEEKYDESLLYSKSVFTLTNDGNIFRNVKEYSSLSDLFNLFDAFAFNDKDQNHYKHFVNFVRYFTKRLDSGKYDTTWRNRLCNEILNFKNIVGTVEAYLGDVSMNDAKAIPFLDKIINIYNNKTQCYMKTEMVELCKSVGNRIGAYCREKDDKGILFSIRNSKNRSEFLSVLAETQFRTEVTYSELFFKELPENSQWEDYKSLVSIFAMNSFLYKDLKTTTETNNQLILK